MRLGGGDQLVIDYHHFINYRSRGIVLLDQSPRCVAHLLPFRGVL